MRKAIGFIILALVLTGCGAAPETFDPALAPFVYRFRDLAQLNSHPIDLSNLSVLLGDPTTYFSPPNPSIIGLCNAAGLKQVTISSIFWKNITDDMDREQLIFHELGHCVLLRGHRNDTITVPDFDYPIDASIMNASHFNHDEYVAHRDYYLNELFNPPLGITTSTGTSADD